MLSSLLLFRTGTTQLYKQLELTVVGNVIALDELRVVNEELLDATGKQVDVAEAFLGEDLGNIRAVTLVVGKHDNHLVVEVLEATEGLEVIVSVDPAMREAY